VLLGIVMLLRYRKPRVWQAFKIAARLTAPGRGSERLPAAGL